MTAPGSPAGTDTLRSGTGGSPLRAVLTALTEGAPTVAAVRERTGLDPAVVDAAIDHLVRTGRVGVSRLATCAGSCGSCPIAAGCGTAGGTITGSAPSGAETGSGSPRTLLALWVRHD